jgi:hypothetical protein
MLLNLTDRYSVKARDHKYGGIWCSSNRGPSFGNVELWTCEPLLGDEKVLSRVVADGFKIPGKVGEINPLTTDAIIKPDLRDPHSLSTAIEIEVWHIQIEDY